MSDELVTEMHCICGRVFNATSESRLVGMWVQHQYDKHDIPKSIVSSPKKTHRLVWQNGVLMISYRSPLKKKHKYRKERTEVRWVRHLEKEQNAFKEIWSDILNSKTLGLPAVHRRD